METFVGWALPTISPVAKIPGLFPGSDRPAEATVAQVFQPVLTEAKGCS